MWKQFSNEKLEKPILHKGQVVCSKQCDCEACPNEMFKTTDLDNNIYCPYTLEK